MTMPLPFRHAIGLLTLAVAGAASGCFPVPPPNLAETDSVSPSPAKLYVGTMNRAQQAYYLDWDQFAPELEPLGIDIPAETGEHRYEVQLAEPDRVINRAIAKSNSDRSVIGAVYAIEDTTQAIVCEALTPGKVELTAPALAGDTLTCPPGTREI